MKKSRNVQKSTKALKTIQGDVLQELRAMIDKAKGYVSTTVNSTLTLLYWHVGRRIQNEILKGERAEYGRSIVTLLSQQLVIDYGNGFNSKNLHRMMQFAETFPEEKIVVSLTRQLSWTHFVVLIPIQDTLKRDFYAEMCRIEQWNVRTLRKKIDSMLFERTAISKKPDLVIQAEIDALRKEDQLTPDLIFRDPYILEFLNLSDRYVEKDVEDVIIRELEQFLLEMGVGFTFVERQKRIIIDDENFHIDLLFFHRKLKRLVAIELLCGAQHNNSIATSLLSFLWKNERSR